MNKTIGKLNKNKICGIKDGSNTELKTKIFNELNYFY